MAEARTKPHTLSLDGRGVAVARRAEPGEGAKISILLIPEITPTQPSPIEGEGLD
jgi:hypothetical protein